MADSPHEYDDEAIAREIFARLGPFEAGQGEVWAAAYATGYAAAMADNAARAEALAKELVERRDE